MANGRATGGMPGWVKGFAIAGGLLIFVIVLMVAMGHGPWQHMAMHG